MEQEQIEKIASELDSWLQEAMGDCAHGAACLGGTDEYRKWLNTSGKSIHGSCLTDAYADHLYNDIDTLRDLLGDRIHDEAAGHPYNSPEFNKDFIAIAEKIAEHAHPALKEACKQLADARRVI
ncbi:MAG: hypothetical protein DRI97_03900 [Bacteroidetes bacterium]|nr:MAG: hypothetical protein DRQ42_00415 [Gammaproteobacteria bacterium]RLD58098.1 MAG: hypothetical protein DRI97_03900 [Bacteroidota bacterium]